MPLSILFADNYVEIHFNSHWGHPLTDNLAIGEYNRLEFWLENDAVITGMSNAIEVYGYAGIVLIDSSYGNVAPMNVEDPDILNGLYQIHIIQASAPGLPDTIGVAGVAIPPHNGMPGETFRLGYSYQLHIPEGQPSGEICVRPAFANPSAQWLWADEYSVEIIPDFYDCQIADPYNPDCPGVCFPVNILPPTAGFEFDIDCGVYPVNVQFTDLSILSPETWEWDFGDGNSSTEQNPLHTYTTPGEYYPSLTVTNSQGQDTYTSTTPIVVKDSLELDFTSNQTNGVTPLYVEFTSIFSYTPDSLKWTFGDGNTSTDPSPFNVYMEDGEYDVTLEAWVCGTYFSLTKAAYIITGQGSGQICGDVNCDGRVNVSDAIYIINFSFIQGSPAPCENCP